MTYLFRILLLATTGLAGLCDAAQRPNILFCISDDQSYAHAGTNGDPVVQTPAFDRIAREGIRFTNAFCDAPSCGPSRNAMLTGQPIWRLEEGGNIHSTLPKKFLTYTELLEESGYFLGYTGKGWGPGRLEPGGRTSNPIGKEYSKHRLKKRIQGIANKDYAKNFADFLIDKPEGKPFCFWLGTHEPHRAYKKGAGIAAGKDPKQVIVPPCLPDHDIVRSDILDYYMEVEHFDKAVADAIELLEQHGQLENTIIVVTSDHGMPFTRAKATLYDLGTRVPLAIRWGNRIKSPGRTYEGLVNLSDLAPTFLIAAELKPPAMMTAHDLSSVFSSPAAEQRLSAFIAMERHDGCRKGGKGYPCRAIRTAEFLYIRNYEPDRWPAGDPDKHNCARFLPYGEYDSNPSKLLLMENEDRFQRLHKLAFAKRPAEELYDLENDAGQMNNVANRNVYTEAKKILSDELQRHLAETKDPRALGLDAPWDFYPYYGKRKNKNWKVDSKP